MAESASFGKKSFTFPNAPDNPPKPFVAPSVDLENSPPNAEDKMFLEFDPVKKPDILLTNPRTGEATLIAAKTLISHERIFPAVPLSSNPLKIPPNVSAIIVPTSYKIVGQSISEMNSPIFCPSSSHGISSASRFSAPSRFVRKVLSL